MKKIVLGTAQFGFDYGINNERGKVPKEEVFKILDTAYLEGIDTLDTASTYGDSEELIGQYLKETGRTFKIISKIGLAGREGVKESLVNTLERLGIECLYCYLVHRFEEYLAEPGIWPELKKLKSEGKSQKIGFSLYHPEELKILFERKIDFDLIQVPYNILDQRFKPYLCKLKEKDIEVHVRSVFWQGLVFKQGENLNGKLVALKNGLDQLEAIARQAKCSRASLCLDFALKHECIDKVVLGIDGIDHLAENVRQQVQREEGENALDGVASLQEHEIKMVYAYLIEMVKERENRRKIARAL